MTKAFGRIATILACSTICGFVIRNVSGFVPISPWQTRNNRAMKSRGMTLNYAAENEENFGPVSAEGRQADIVQLTNRFSSPVLKQNFEKLLEWKETYGHPNVPLKNDGGNACQVLRRLHVQKKLTAEEVEWLEEIGFRFHSLEDVYRFADFDALLDRLLAYEETHPSSNFQVPKKCPEDPELGAWVTGIRRLGKEGVNPDHERRLSEINFVWQSTRKCGSKFMMQYREWVKQVEQLGLEAVMEDPNTISWIVAQQQALKRGTLSQTRVQYMGQLFGETWTTIGKEDDDRKI